MLSLIMFRWVRVQESYLEESTGWWFDTSGKQITHLLKVIKKQAYFGKANMINDNSASGAGVGADGEN